MKKFISALILLFAISSLQAQERLTIDQLAGKTGELHLKLTERSPLSTLAEMAKRMNTKLDPAAKDYDLSAQDFYVYIPPAPADDGKYGLIDVLPFADGHGFAPEAIRPMLDKYHLIWIGPMHGGDDQPSQQRIGELVDVVFNARKALPISESRVYAMISSGKAPETATALYYSELFTGVLQNGWMTWFASLREGKGGIWPTNNFPRPRDESLGAAKNGIKFIFVQGDGESDNHKHYWELIVKLGYQQVGMRYVKLIRTPSDGVTTWSSYTGDWFEQGIQYLDDRKGMPARKGASGLAATRPSPATHASAVSQPSAKPNSAADQADRALSLAKNYIASNRYDTARQKLQKVIEDFPTTKAAGEAKKLLDEIKGK